jgi:hypothetical protein
MKLTTSPVVFITIVCLVGCAASRKHREVREAFVHFEPSDLMPESLALTDSAPTHPALNEPQPPSQPPPQPAQVPLVLPPSEIEPLPAPPLLPPPEIATEPAVTIPLQIAALPPPPAQVEQPKPEPTTGQQKSSLGLLAFAPIGVLALWMAGRAVIRNGRP